MGVSYLSNDVYQTIAARLATFDPAIKIRDHIQEMYEVGRTTLQGIRFKAVSVDNLLLAFRSARDGDKLTAFAEGSTRDPNHWALRLSYNATNGVGFREIWRPQSLSDRPLSIDDGQPNRFRSNWRNQMTARFNDSTQDVSSVHAAVAADECNVHIDERSFVITGADGGVVVDPDFAQHMVNELLYKTNLNGIFPNWMIDRLSIELPNSSNQYANRVGISGDLVQRKNLRVRLTASCSILGPFEYSGTVSVSGKF